MSSKNQAQAQNQSTAKQPPQKPNAQPDKTLPALETHPGVILQRARLDPDSLTSGDIQQLQRTIGNQRTGQILTQHHQNPPTQGQPSAFSPQASLQRMLANRGIQAKLTVNAPGDRYEQEADTVAKQVVSTINTPPPPTATTAQRQEDEEMAMTKPINPIQRQEDEEVAMTKPATIQRAGYENGGTVDNSVETTIQQARGGGQPLADNIRGPMEQAFGADFSGVNIHTDAQSHQLNQAVQAKAFTTGQDIFFRQGEYNPGSSSGQELIAHELTHVVQQTGSTVQRQEIKPAPTPPHPSIQRRVAMAKEAPSGNFVELTSVNYAIKRAGGPAQLLKDSDFSNMQPNEMLYIVAHGSVGSSGDYSASQIADFLTDETTGLQNSIKGIIFTSCYAGKGQVMYDESDSVVGVLSDRLTDAGFGNVTVIGAKGPSIKTDEMGGDYTVWDKSKKVTLECDALQKTYNLPAVQVVEKVLTLLMNPQGKATLAIASLEVGATMEERAEAASKATGDFYKALVQMIKDPGASLGLVEAVTEEVVLKLNSDWGLQVTKEELKAAVTKALTTWSTLELEEKQVLTASTSLSGFGP